MSCTCTAPKIVPGGEQEKMYSDNHPSAAYAMQNEYELWAVTGPVLRISLVAHHGLGTLSTVLQFPHSRVE